MQLPWQQVHFTGAGGVGMSGLIHLLLDAGVRVTGTDMVESRALEDLRSRGAEILAAHDATMLAGAELLVYSNAVPDTNPELRRARESGLTMLGRGAFLARLASFFSTVVAVAGSHGKTTTSAMLAHILERLGLEPGYLVGGQLCGRCRAATLGGGRILVTEVDESDGSQALLHSSCAVIVNIEDDHCWSVGGIESLEQCFRDFSANAEQVIAWDTPAVRRVLADFGALRLIAADDTPPSLQLAVPAEFNRINATLALAAATALRGESVLPQAVAALADFEGVERRLTQRLVTADERIVVLEDYAHHPTEVRAALSAVRELYPGHRLTVVFQPHRFERVQRYGSEFATILASADELVVAPTFAAWHEPGPEEPCGGVIAAQATAIPARFHRGTTAELAAALSGTVLSAAARGARSRQLIVVMGAGDVCSVIPPLKRELTVADLERCCRELQERFADAAVGREQSWARRTSLGIGSARPLCAKPCDSVELQELARAAAGLGLGLNVLGKGTNLVGTDTELPQLLLTLETEHFRRFEWLDEDFVLVGAGLALRQVCVNLAQAGRLSAADAALAWVPGSLGGGVRMNAGAHGASVAGMVARVHGITHQGEEWRAGSADIEWGYRSSSIPEDVIITELLLRPGRNGAGPAELRRAWSRTGRARRRSLPRQPSAGSVFRNPGADKTAGSLLEFCGFRGRQQGGCGFSAQHANVIVKCDASANEEAVLGLIMLARREVFKRTGIKLETELHFANPASRERLLRQSALLGS
jgi:UDP-N-acetylmuramate--alanine ligase